MILESSGIDTEGMSVTRPGLDAIDSVTSYLGTQRVPQRARRIGETPGGMQGTYLAAVRGQ